MIMFRVLCSVLYLSSTQNRFKMFHLKRNVTEVTDTMMMFVTDMVLIHTISNPVTAPQLPLTTDTDSLNDSS